MSDNNLVAKTVTTLALTVLSLGILHLWLQWRENRQSSSDVDPERSYNALRRLGRSASEFNSYEMGLLSEVIFPEEAKTSFDDVAGLDDVKMALFEGVIMPFQNPAKYASKLLGVPKVSPSWHSTLSESSTVPL